MVAAGTYVIARLFPLYAEHDAARTLLAVLAAVTMVYAALLAFAQTDLKRMLAYSTLSQIAIMLSALAAAPAELGPAPASRTSSATPSSRRCSSSAPAGSSVLAGATALAALRGRLRADRSAALVDGHRPRRARRRAAAHRLLHQGHRHRRRARGRDAAAAGSRAWLVVVALFVTVVLTAAYCTRAWLLLDTPVAATGELPDARAGRRRRGGRRRRDDRRQRRRRRGRARPRPRARRHHAARRARRLGPRRPHRRRHALPHEPARRRARRRSSAPCCPSCSSPAPRMPCGPSATAAGSTSPT